ncbi:MAG: DUF4270 domain-containing protein [Bacteroidales bacterium]|jgi:hypothetical protein|nr:DUF4270 domain-containing protein [Bacteroidales bacterium]
MLKKLKYVLMFLPFVAASCVDEDENLGLELVNQDELHFNHYDALTLHSVFFHEDSMKTSGAEIYALGSYQDNTFGSVSSTIYTQISLPDSKDFTTLNIDSIVLGLYYTDSFTKDTAIRTMQMHVEVRELAGDIMDTACAFDSVEVSTNQPLFSGSVVFNPDTIMVLGEDTITKQLRLKLSDDFINRLHQQSFADNAAFQQWLKGLRIKASPASSASNGMLAQFSLTNQTSGIFIYYSDNDNRNLKYRLVVDKNSKRFAQIKYNFSGSNIASLATDTLKSENYNNTMYIGGLGISMAKISIDSLLQWYNLDEIKGSAINQAVLVLPVADNNFSNDYPSTLYCAYDTAGVLKYVDDLASSASYFNGYYDAKSNSYRMRITQHLFKCMKGDHPSHNLYIHLPSRALTPHRIILNSPTHPTNPARIEITYSRQ